MSTRANIIITDDSGEKLWFYKHSDGYPEGTMPILRQFLDMVRTGKIRNNVMQAAGWLVVLGREELLRDKHSAHYSSWKVGDIEPTTCQHEDIEFLYTVNLDTKDITVKEV
jgi:hypothetical protein